MAPFKKSAITAIIPTKNESEGVSKIIHEVKKYAGEIIVVDGNSTDGTFDIARKSGVKCYLDNGLGRGDALKIGVKHATNEIIVFVDADGSHEISDIPILINTLVKQKADMVISSRRTGGSSDMEMNFEGLLRSAGSDLLVMLLNYKFKTHLTDILYSFRAVRKSKFNKVKLKSKGFTIEQEMVVGFLQKNLNVIEIPSREKRRAWGKSKLKTVTGVSFIFSLLFDLYLRRW